MERSESILTRDLRNAIVVRAAFANSQSQIGQTIVLELLRAGIRSQQIGPGEVKSLLVEALRVCRKSHESDQQNRSERSAAGLQNIQAWARQNQCTARLDGSLSS